MSRTKTKARKNIGGTKDRSRSTRRATSPSINTDKSLKDLPRTSDSTPLLSANTNAGIHKAKRNHKGPKRRAQKERQEKGLARAEAVMDQMEKKVDGVKKRTIIRNERRQGWDEINGMGKEERRRKVLGEESWGMMENQDDGDEWEDEPEAAAPKMTGNVTNPPLEVVDGEVVLHEAVEVIEKLKIVDQKSMAVESEVEDEIT